MSILTGNPFLPPPFPVHRFSVDEYHEMIQKGILKEDDRVELRPVAGQHLVCDPVHDILQGRDEG